MAGALGGDKTMRAGSTVLVVAHKGMTV